MADAVVRDKAKARDQRRERRASQGRRCGDLPLLEETWGVLYLLTGIHWETKRGDDYYAAMDACAKVIDEALKEHAKNKSTRGNFDLHEMASLIDVEPLEIRRPLEPAAKDEDDDEH